MMPFLRALIECTLTMSAVVVTLWLISPMLARRYSATGLYWTWTVVLLGFLIPFRVHIGTPAFTLPAQPMLLSPLSLSQSSPLPERGALVADVADTALGFSSPGAVPMQAEPSPPSLRALSSLSIAQLAAAVWLLGAATLFFLRLCQHLRFLRVLRRWRKSPADPRYAAALLEAESSLGCVSGATLWICPAVDSPMMIGLFRPAFLLPELSLDFKELEIVLRHELVHWRRGDVWFRLCALLASALHWFNPLLSLAARTQAFYCEASCDAVVTRGADLDTRQFYSETILRVIRRRRGSRTPLSTSFYAGKGGMKRRIFSIMDAAGKRAGGGLAAAALLCLLGSGMVFALDVQEAVSTVAQEPSSLATASPVLIPDATPVASPVFAEEPTQAPTPEPTKIPTAEEDLTEKLLSGPPQHTWSLEEKARLLSGHGLPGAGDITQEEALRITNEALLQRYGSASWFSELTPYFSFIIDDAGHFETPNWQIDYFDERSLNAAGFGRLVFEVKVSAATGEVIYLSGPGEGNG